jgi:polysaccharide export outer membrane protein
VLASGFVYISGEVQSAGERPLTNGMTLSQAVTAAGGAKGDLSKATVRRRGAKGILNVVDYDLRAIRAGKASDPVLVPGDMIEISN